MRLRLPTINHRLPTCQSTARVCGLLDRVGDALAEERERLELKAIEMLKGRSVLRSRSRWIMLGGMMVPFSSLECDAALFIDQLFHANDASSVSSG